MNINTSTEKKSKSIVGDKRDYERATTRNGGMKPSSCLFTYEVSQIAAWTALVVLAEVRHAPRYAQGSKTTCTFKIQLFLFRTGVSDPHWFSCGPGSGNFRKCRSGSQESNIK